MVPVRYRPNAAKVKGQSRALHRKKERRIQWLRKEITYIIKIHEPACLPQRFLDAP